MILSISYTTFQNFQLQICSRNNQLACVFFFKFAIASSYTIIVFR